MAYFTTEQFRAALQESDLRELSDDAAGENPNVAILTDIAARASDVCDSYIMTAYTVPVAGTVHQSLRRAALGIATYLLHIRRSWAMNDAVKEEYDNCIAWLKRVGDGKAEIPGALPRPGNSGSYFTSNDQKFTETTMQGFG